MKKIGAVLVGAGVPQKMVEFKPLLPFRDSTIALHIVTMLKQLNIDPIVVVTGYKAEELEKHLSHLDILFVKNEQYQHTQMLDSVVLGMKKIGNECDRLLIMPMDLPNIMKETIENELKIQAPIIRTAYHEKGGHPIIIEREVYDYVFEYHGDDGLRGALETSGYPIITYAVEDSGVIEDIDTQEEYQAIIKENYLSGKGHPIHPAVKITLSGNEVFFGPGVKELLKNIDETGSIQEACLQMGMSYSKGRKMLKNIEHELGYSVVKRWTGGNGGGGSSLNDEGKALMECYELMENELNNEVMRIFKKYFNKGFKKI